MTSKLSTVWQLMSQYTFEINPDSINEDLMCTMCKQLMIDACQTACGCQYCTKCISNYLSEGDKYCVGGKEECTEEYLVMERNVMKNIRMNNMISKLRVICPNELCQFSSELSKMEEHLNQCNAHTFQCPYALFGCDKLQRHVHNDSDLHTQMLIDLINNLKNEVEGFKDKLGTNECERTAMEIKLEETAESINARITSYRNEIVNVNQELKNKTNKIAALERQLKSKDNRVAALEEAVSRLESRIAAMGTQLDKREKDVVEMKEGYARMEKNMITMRETLGETDYQQKNVLNAKSSTKDFDFRWTVDKLSHRRKTIYSEAFYARGYKLCMSVHIAGSGIYVWCYVMRGSGDHKLAWPLRLPVTLGVVNQRTQKVCMAHTFHRDSYSEYYLIAFDRPTGVRNDYSIGSTSMIRYSAIKDKDAVIVNDSIVVGCGLGDNQ